MVTVLSFPKHELSRVTIGEGHSLIGLDDLLSTINKNYFTSFRDSYDKFCNLLNVDNSFDHQFGTIILNAKLNCQSMSYGSLIFRIQENFSCPSTIDIHLTAPHYGTPDII